MTEQAIALRIAGTLPHLEARYRPGEALAACQRAVTQGDLSTVHRVGSELEELGRVLSSLSASAAPPPPSDLAELSRLERSRPQALALLDALRHCQRLAEDLDEAHGRSDWEDDLTQLIARAELAYHGPSERVTGGRE